MNTDITSYDQLGHEGRELALTMENDRGYYRQLNPAEWRTHDQDA